MNNQKQKEQIEKLEKLKQKRLPDHIQKSIAEKQKHIQKPFNK